MLSSLAAGGGSITIDGTGGGDVAGGHGIFVTGTATLVDSKSGAIQVTGTGGAPASSHSIFMSAGADITSSDAVGAATITIMGTGSPGSASAGMIFSDAGTTIASITGAIDVTAVGLGASDSGLFTTGGTIESTGAATVTITGSAVNGNALTFGNTEIGDAAGSGTITLIGDEVVLSGTTVIDGQGQLIFKPLVASTTIGLGGGA